MAPELDLQPIHTRTYHAQGFLVDEATLLVRGTVKDVLPPDFYDVSDNEPLVMHHMVVDLTIALEDLTITDAQVYFEAHPHGACPEIIGHYGKLVGLSIARGFTHQVRELFGGPRGCSHTTALLQAMAPVAMQCKLASSRFARGSGEPLKVGSAEARRRRLSGNRNTCHVWIEGGEHLTAVEHGTLTTMPIPITLRLRERGIDPEQFRHDRWA